MELFTIHCRTPQEGKNQTYELIKDGFGDKNQIHPVHWQTSKYGFYQDKSSPNGEKTERPMINYSFKFPNKLVPIFNQVSQGFYKIAKVSETRGYMLRFKGEGERDPF